MTIVRQLSTGPQAKIEVANEIKTAYATLLEAFNTVPIFQLRVPVVAIEGYNMVSGDLWAEDTIKFNLDYYGPWAEGKDKEEYINEFLEAFRQFSELYGIASQ